MAQRLFKVLGKVWFTVRGNQTIGIVLMNNGYEDKAYIGIGTGVSEEKDLDYILAWGSPFSVDAAKLLIGDKIGK
jgi:hypothetical protein